MIRKMMLGMCSLTIALSSCGTTQNPRITLTEEETYLAQRQAAFFETCVLGNLQQATGNWPFNRTCEHNSLNMTNALMDYVDAALLDDVDVVDSEIWATRHENLLWVINHIYNAYSAFPKISLATRNDAICWVGQLSILTSISYNLNDEVELFGIAGEDPDLHEFFAEECEFDQARPLIQLNENARNAAERYSINCSQTSFSPREGRYMKKFCES